MKEERFFYAPDIKSDALLPEDEAQHALRVLRMQVGDVLWLMDGCGTFYRSEICGISRKSCEVCVKEELRQTKSWRGTLTLAVAPTKNLDRLEWLTEKAVEIGVDRIVLLDCHNSERNKVKLERLERIVVSAMKQSRKPWKTELVEMTKSFDFFQCQTGTCYIAHCYDDHAVVKRNLIDVINHDDDVVVAVGPEGDFSIDEINCAIANRFVPVALGKSRLRTETAGLVATHVMQLTHSL